MHRSLRAALASIALLAAVSCERCSCGHRPAIAHVGAYRGDVAVARRHTPQLRQPVQAAEALFLEDTITTGPQSQATLIFRGGTKLTLGASTSLVLRPVGGASAELGAILIAGEVQAQTNGDAPPVAVQTPQGVAQLGTRLAEIVLSVEHGVRVKVGAIDVTTPQGQQKTIAAGKELTIGGLEMDIGGAVEGLDIGVKKRPPTVAPKVFSLFNPEGRAQVQRSGVGAWEARPRQSSLKSGDVMRLVGSQGGATVSFEDGGVLAIRRGEVSFTAAAKNPEPQPDYRLQGTHASMHLLAKSTEQVEHVVHVAGAPLRVRPTVEKADVDIEQGPQGAQLAVRFGELILDHNQRIEAGCRVRIKNGNVQAIEPLTPFSVDVKAEAPTVLYYKDAVPPVNFVWSSSKTEPRTMQLATNSQFDDTLARERVSRGSLILDRLAAGQYFWRTLADDKHFGTLQIAREPPQDCLRCRRVDLVRDNGEQTLVYFQQQLPKVELSWAAVKGVSKYRLQIFDERNLDTPLVEKVVSSTSKRFGNGQPFVEGRYAWLAKPADASPKDYRAHLNSLILTYDNAQTALLVRAPAQNARLKAVVARGEAQIGSQLWVNDKQAHLDETGRFRVAMSLPAGRQHVVFRSVGKNGVQQIYTRDVTVGP